ncbi:unnamed protein product, partial [Closterium sp. NIES-54]
LPRHVTVDLVGVGAGGAATGGTRSGGARSRGAGFGGAGARGDSPGGAGAGGPGTGGACSGGAEVGGPGTGGAWTRGAGAGDPDPVGTPSGDTGSGGASSETTGAGGTMSTESTLPPHRRDTCYQAACRRAREEQERLERERQELRQLDLLEHGLWALGLPSSPPVRSPSPPAFGPTFSPHDARPAVWSSPPPQSPPPVVRHYRSNPFLPSPPPSSLPVSPTPLSDYYRAVRPVFSRILATGVTDPRFSLSSVSALTAAIADLAAAVADFAAASRHSCGAHSAYPSSVRRGLTGPFPDEPFEPSGPYPELVGCLMYLMTCTCPDLAYPLSVLSRFVGLGRHRPVHRTAAVRVAKYPATTSGMGLVLGGTRPVELTGLCDSSYTDGVETQRSSQGYCFSLGAGAVSWRSTRSSSVASSSVEAEIYAGAMAAQELHYLTFLLADLGERPRTAPTLFADNKAMILLCREPRLETRVKHIDVRYFLLRELQRRGQVRLDFVASEANTADLFTKALAPGDHHRFCVLLGLVEVGPWLL